MNRRNPFRCSLLVAGAPLRISLTHGSDANCTAYFKAIASLVRMVLPFTLSIMLAISASADSIDLSTSTPSNWTVTGGNAVNAPAFLYAPLSGISITSNGYASGSFASGGSIQAFNGFWYGTASFFLPANATDVSLDYAGLEGDDRVVLQLNGTNIGDYFLNGNESNPPLTGIGVMRFAVGSSDQPFTFTGVNSGAITDGFFVGGENVLTLVVNNTFHADLTAPTVPLQGPGDATHAQLIATVNYTTAVSVVPEPAGMITILFGIGIYGCGKLVRCYVRKN